MSMSDKSFLSTFLGSPQLEQLTDIRTALGWELTDNQARSILSRLDDGRLGQLLSVWAGPFVRFEYRDRGTGFAEGRGRGQPREPPADHKNVRRDHRPPCLRSATPVNSDGRHEQSSERCLWARRRSRVTMFTTPWIAIL